MYSLRKHSFSWGWWLNSYTSNGHTHLDKINQFLKRLIQPVTTILFWSVPTQFHLSHWPILCYLVAKARLGGAFFVTIFINATIYHNQKLTATKWAKQFNIGGNSRGTIPRVNIFWANKYFPANQSLFLFHGHSKRCCQIACHQLKSPFPFYTCIWLRGPNFQMQAQVITNFIALPSSKAYHY